MLKEIISLMFRKNKQGETELHYPITLTGAVYNTKTGNTLDKDLDILFSGDSQYPNLTSERDHKYAFRLNPDGTASVIFKEVDVND